MPELVLRETGWQAESVDTPAWVEHDNWSGSGPLRLACDVEPEPAMTSASAIAIEFPAFNDGRALSLAVLLRTRLGYTGELWAVGEVHEDILHYMARCGFTVLQLPADKDTELALSLLQPYSDYYQGAVQGPQTAQSEPRFKRVADRAS